MSENEHTEPPVTDRLHAKADRLAAPTVPVDADERETAAEYADAHEVR